MNKWGPLNRSFTIHARYLLLEELADVNASTLQRGGEEAIGDAEHLRVKVEVLDLKGGEEAGQSSPGSKGG